MPSKTTTTKKKQNVAYFLRENVLPHLKFYVGQSTRYVPETEAALFNREADRRSELTAVRRKR